MLLLLLLSAHADSQGVDISFTVCNLVCLFVCRVTVFSAEDSLNLAASNFARRFIGVQWKSPIFVNFASPKAQNRPANRPARALNYK